MLMLPIEPLLWPVFGETGHPIILWHGTLGHIGPLEA